MLNVSLKELFEVPRPNLSPLIDASGWAFPSGHSQVSATIRSRATSRENHTKR